MRDTAEHKKRGKDLKPRRRRSYKELSGEALVYHHCPYPNCDRKYVGSYGRFNLQVHIREKHGQQQLVIEHVKTPKGPIAPTQIAQSTLVNGYDAPAATTLADVNSQSLPILSEHQTTLVVPGSHGYSPQVSSQAAFALSSQDYGPSSYSMSHIVGSQLLPSYNAHMDSLALRSSLLSQQQRTNEMLHDYQVHFTPQQGYDMHRYASKGDKVPLHVDSSISGDN
jgi:hypothetical protein